MPQVPRIQPQSVEQRPISAPQAPTQAPLEQFGGGQSAAGVLEAGGQLSRTVSLIYQEEKKKADQVAVLGADQELSRWETERLYKAETGAMNKKGKDAFGLPDEVNKDFTKIVGDITSKLNNDDQRLAFQRMATSRGVDIERSLTKHVSAEMRSYDDTITESYLKTEREAAVANFSDNERVDIGIERQKGAIVDYANRYGLPQEYVKLKTQEAVSKTRTDVVSRYLAVGDDLKAKAYYDQHKDEFSGADQMHMDKALEEGSLRGESQRINDKIMSTAKTRSEAMQMVKELSGSNPKLREVAENLTTSSWNRKLQEKKELEDDLYQQSANMIDAARGSGKPVRHVVPNSTWVLLTPEHQLALERRGTDPANDDKVWLDFLSLSASQTSQLSRVDFEAKYWTKFDQAHRTRAEQMWDASKNQNAKDPVLSTVITAKDRIDNTLKTSGLISATKEKSKYSADEAKFYAQFEQKVAQSIENFEINDLGGKRKATGEEIQKVIDGLVVNKVFVEKSWATDPEKLASFLTEDERGAAYVPIDKVPLKERKSIENMLRSKGKRIKDSKVERAYGAFLVGDRKRVEEILSE